MQSQNELKIAGEYGFTVTHRTPSEYEETDAPVFDVALPHQCDEWAITWGKDRAGAIADLEAFIAQAAAAVALLRTTPDAVAEKHRPRFVEAGRVDERGRGWWRCAEVWSDGVRCESDTWGDPADFDRYGPCSYLRRDLESAG